MLRFRRLRRLTAVAQLLLLPLAWLSGAGLCPCSHGMRTDAAAMTGHAVAPVGTALSDHSATHAHQHGTDCDMACTPASCDAASHCSQSAASAATAPASVSTSARSVPIGDRDGALRSVSTAPEPPPPRA